MSYKILQEDGFGILLEDGSGYVLYDTLNYEPTSDITATNFTNTFADIDEYNPDDTDFIYSTNATVGVYEGKFAPMTDPVNETGHIFSYRIANMNAGVLSGTAFAKVTAELYQGATLIKADAQKTGSATWTTYTLTLTNLEAATITDYTDLRLRLTTTNVALRGIGISYIAFTIPNYVDPTEENTLTNTELFSTNWTKTASSITTFALNSPELAGQFNAAKEVENTANTGHALSYTRRNVMQETVCYSIYVKAGERAFVRIGFTNASALVARCTFNLTTGLITTISANSADFVNFNAFIKDVGGGWWQISVTVNKFQVNNINDLELTLASAVSTYSYLGDGASGLYIWGPNLNLGTIPASYILKPTPAIEKLAALGVG